MDPFYIVTEGDSLTTGVGSTGTEGPWPMQLARLFPDNRMVSIVSIGLSGDTLALMLTEAATQITPLYDSRKANNVVCIWAGINDIVVSGRTAAQTYADMQTYCAARRATGFKVYPFTLSPSTSAAAIAAGYEASRQSFNTSMRNGWTSFADGLIDIGADPTVGVAGASDNLTYYISDKVHMTNAGYAIVASIARAALGP